MSVGFYVIVALPFVFGFACYKAKQLIPLQLALLALVVCLFRVGVDTQKIAFDTRAFFNWGHARASYSVLFPDIRYVFLPESDLKWAEAAERSRLAAFVDARSGLDSEAAAISAEEAHPSPNDQYRQYPLPGQYAQSVYGGGGDVDPDFQERETTGLSSAAPFWKPAILEKARQAIDAKRQAAITALATVDDQLHKTGLQKLGLVAWTHALHFFDEFLYFFPINLAAYGAALMVERLKRLRRKGMQTAN